MKTFFDRLIYKFNIFMQGRYGFDSLSKSMVIASLVLMLLANIVRGLWFFANAAWILIILAYYRAFSRNIYKRNRELIIFNKSTDKIRKRFRLFNRIRKERKEYKYFKCKNCGAYWRVPRGIGVTEITCRICKEKMTKKT